MHVRLWGVLGIGLIGLACGGAGGVPEAEKESEVAFTTYESGGTRIVFTTKEKVKKTWRNMSGSAAPGTYTHVGTEIVIQYAAAENHSNATEKLTQMGPCSMARYERIEVDGTVHDDSPMIYEQKKPRCDTVRVR